MAFAARVLADSISPTGDRLTTIVGTYPRKIHSEFMTHRMFSRNSASSRAIPVEKLLKMIEEDPVVPIWWGANQSGMQAREEVADKEGAEAWWREGLSAMVAHARKGSELGLHKQIVNRVVESGMWITVVMSATTWSNFEGLRVHKDAEPHFQRFAGMAMEAIAASTPRKLEAGQWHLPFISDEEQEITSIAAKKYLQTFDLKGDLTDKAAIHAVQLMLVKVSVGRCARVSYLTHEGKRDMREDIALHDRMMVQAPLHASPAEHVALALDYPSWFKRLAPSEEQVLSVEMNRRRFEARKRNSTGDITVFDMMRETALAQIQSGNFRGWRQYRKTHVNEHIGEEMP